jgi:hypothetical protein
MSAIGIRKLIIEREQAAQVAAQLTAPGIGGAEGSREVPAAPADAGFGEHEAAQTASSDSPELHQAEDAVATPARVEAEAP